MTASAGTHPTPAGEGRRAATGSGRVLAAVALLGGLAGITVLAVVMMLGPSAAVPRIGPGGPMWSLSARPAAATVTALERTGLLLGALGVASGLAAVRRGWRPPARLLIAVGAVVAGVFVFLPPAGSIDVLNYAIYGRIAALGHNPYLMRPVELRASGDPVGVFAPANWRTLPTIYGPVASALQWAAARLGGASMARIVFWIRLGNAIAFVATAIALARLAGSDRARQARACLLWAVNPLLLFWLVGSGHIDVMLALLAVLALLTTGLAMRRSGVVAGAVIGLIVGVGVAIKTPFVVAGIGIAAAARRAPRPVGAMLVCATAVLIPCYLLPGAVNAAVLSRRLAISAGFIYPVPAAVASRPAAFAGLVLLATLTLALVLLWRLPAAHPAPPPVRTAVALTLAWLAVFPVQAPWYDALIFPLAALMPISGLDYLLVFRCLLLSEIVLPGVLPDSGPLSVAVARFSHLGLLGLLAALIVMCVPRFLVLRDRGGVPDIGL